VKIRFLRLSKSLYRFLKTLGIPLSPSRLSQLNDLLFARGKWSEAKSALLEEASAQKRSAGSVFAKALLKQINSMNESDNPFAGALFQGKALTPNSGFAPCNASVDLTADQTEALKKALGSPLLFIMGPPGTGKSRVTVELVRQLSLTQQVLFCCSTKAALENARDQLNFNHPNLTLRTITALIQSSTNQSYDSVIIDEAGMVNPAQTLYLTSLAKSKIIFVGDPIQLPPVSSNDNPWNSQSIFLNQSKSSNLSELYLWQQNNPDRSVLLKEQFDIPNRIFNVLNQFCYGGRLSNHSKASGHIAFIDSSKLSPRNTGKSSSPINQVHADLVIESLSSLLKKENSDPHSIGVITPFKEQAKFLRKTAKLNGLPEEIEFGTVHTFQGRLKSSIVLDVTAAGVDYPYQILSDSDQASALMNSALARCRTSSGSEGRLIIIADMEHLRAIYPDSVLISFLSRLFFRADLLDGEDLHKYSQATDSLVDLFNDDWSKIENQFQSHDPPNGETIRRFIYNGCDLIQRLIQLCNRIHPKAFDSRNALHSLERPSAALNLSDLAPSLQFDAQNAILFRSFISDLYKVIYESTMVPVPGEHKNRGPDKPIYDPEADNGVSYGRVRIWVRELRNYYQHDNEKPQEYRREFSKRQRDYLFNSAIGRPAPDENKESTNPAEDYSRSEYLQVTLFLLTEITCYLNLVRAKLR
jgi:hypothetical protein